MAWKTGLSSGGPNHCAFNHDSGAHICPERDQQLSRQRHDRRLAPTTAAAFHSVLEPESERRARLMAYPKPGELNHRCPQSRVARLRDALLAIDRPALPRRWGEAGISGDLRLSKCLESPSHQRTEANSGPMPWTSSNIGGGADTLACSALSSASRSSSTALICSRSNSSRSSSRQTWALRCWGKRRPSPV